MKINIKKSARRLAGVLAASAVCASASAIDFTFSQGGFAGGETISGSFSGSDIVSVDGFLSYFPGYIEELTAFSLTFSNSSGVALFTWGLAELEGFSFKLNGGDIIGDDYDLDPFAAPELLEGIALYDLAGNSVSIGESFTGGSGAFLYLEGDFYESASDATSKQVPDAGSSAALLGGAMLGLFGLGRRFRAKR